MQTIVGRLGAAIVIFVSISAPVRADVLNFFAGSDPQFDVCPNSYATAAHDSMVGVSEMLSKCTDCSKVLTITGDLSHDRNDPRYGKAYRKASKLAKILDGLGNHDINEYKDDQVSFNSGATLAAYPDGGNRRLDGWWLYHHQSSQVDFAPVAVNPDAYAARLWLNCPANAGQFAGNSIPMKPGQHEGFAKKQSNFGLQIQPGYAVGLFTRKNQKGNRMTFTGTQDCVQGKYASLELVANDCPSFRDYDAYYCRTAQAQYYTAALAVPGDNSGTAKAYLVQLHNQLYSRSAVDYLEAVWAQLQADGQTGKPVVLMAHQMEGDPADRQRFHTLVSNMNVAAILHGHYHCTAQTAATQCGHCDENTTWAEVTSVSRQPQRQFINVNGQQVIGVNTNSLFNSLAWLVSLDTVASEISFVRLRLDELPKEKELVAGPVRAMLDAIEGKVPRFQNLASSTGSPIVCGYGVGGVPC